MLQHIAKVLLWISATAWGLWLGGLIYEMVVILPLWSAALPGSIIEWNSRPQFIVNPGRFFIPVATACVLSSLGTFFTTWKIGEKWRWHLVSAIAGVAAFGFTLVFFFPKNEVLFANRRSALTGEEITAIAQAWIAGNRVRVAMVAIGYIAALCALSVARQGSETRASSGSKVEGI